MTLTILMVLTLFLAALQARLPTLSWLGGLRIELLPAFVVYAALTFSRRRVLWLAIAAGLAQDSLSGAPFGISALAYGGAAMLMTAIRETLDRDLPWIQIGAGALTAAAGSLVACLFVGFSAGGIAKILLLAFATGVLTPIFFLAAQLIGYWLRVGES